jgi:6-phosphogluconolactonase
VRPMDRLVSESRNQKGKRIKVEWKPSIFILILAVSVHLASCSSYPGVLWSPPVFYTVGGTVSGLTGTGLVLQDNAGNNLPVTAGATSFTFSTAIASGGSYDVTVFSSPSSPSQTCGVALGSGPVRSANITSVQVTCTTNLYTIGGTVSGLVGTGLVLQDNGGDNLLVNAGATSFTFNTAIASGGSYNVTVFSQPFSPSQTCRVTNSSGPVTNANITSVQITCITPPRSVFAYVSNQRDNTISAYSVAANGTLTALPSSPFAAGRNPAGAAVDPLGKFLYVANVLSSDVSGYLIASDGSLTPIPGSPFPAASGAVSVAIDPTGKFLYVPSCGADCSGSGPGSIVAFTITAGSGVLVPVPGSPFAAGTFPYEMAFGTPGGSPSGGSFAYVVNHTSNNVSAYSIQSTGALSAVPGSPFAAGNGPLALSVDAWLSRLFVVNTYSNNLSIYVMHLDGSLFPIPGSTTATGTFTASVANDANQHLYVAGGSGVFGFTENTFPLTPIAGSPFAAGMAPNCVRLDPSGKFLYVVNEASANISAYSVSPATGILTPIGTFGAGNLPYSIAFTGASQALTWNLVGVRFTNGDTASGSFAYNAGLNIVSNINIVTATTTYTRLAPTFPVHPFEFAFVPDVQLTYGIPTRALVLFPSPGLTNAGGTVSLFGANGISIEGLICDDACDGVTTGAQVDEGSLTSAP